MSPRRVFQRELEALNKQLIAMGAQTEELVKETIHVIVTRDKELAAKVIQKDDIVDSYQTQIEKDCVMMIVQQQPIASDLRFILAVLKIVTDVERIADHCSDICKYIVKIDDGEWTHEEAYKRHIEKMAKDVEAMLNHVMDTFVSRDLEAIKKICDEDDKIDHAFFKIWKELIEEMSAHKEFIPHGAHYIMIIKYLERIADHITNVAEWMIYYSTGQFKEHFHQ